MINIIWVISFIFFILVIFFIVFFIVYFIFFCWFLIIFVIFYFVIIVVWLFGFYKIWGRVVEDLLVCCRGSWKEGGWKVERNLNRGFL